MKKQYLVFAILAIVVLSLTACAKKEPANKLEAIQQAGKIVVGTSADYEPWEYKDENDEFVGIDMEIMREIGKRMGVEVEFQDLGFDTLVAGCSNRKYRCRDCSHGFIFQNGVKRWIFPSCTMPDQTS